MHLDLGYDLEEYRKRAEDGVNAAAAEALFVPPAQQAIYEAKHLAASWKDEQDALLVEEAKLRGCSVAELFESIRAAHARQLARRQAVELARVKAIQSIRRAESPSWCMALLDEFRANLP